MSSTVSPDNKKTKLHKSAGFAQSVVLINGAIITLTAFLIFSFFIKEMTVEQHRRISVQAGDLLVTGISKLEDSMRLISSIILLSEGEDKDKGALVAQIKTNVPNLENFDQIIWLYEIRPGDWQYKIIHETADVRKNSIYRLVPDDRVISQIINDKKFQSEGSLHLVSDFRGMDYIEDKSGTQAMARSFAFVKMVKGNNITQGIIIGVSRAAIVFDDWVMSKDSLVSRLTIMDSQTNDRIYYMDRKISNEFSGAKTTKIYNLPAGDSEWQFSMEFSKENNTLLLEKIPYVILLFGVILTTVGTLFIRNNHTQSKKLGSMNAALELKNNELEAEVQARERLNDVLRVAEKDNRAIIDAVSDVIFETDTNGKVLFLSSSWNKVTGFYTEQSKGRDLFSMIYPDDKEKQKSDFDLLVKGQKQSYHSFTKLRTSDGSFRSIEIAISMIRRDRDGNLRVVGTITDVEERRRAERALAEAEKKYRTIVENAAGGLYQLTPDGMYLSANPAMARILGYKSPADMLRTIKNANGFVYPDLDERKKFMDILINQDQILGYETQVLAHDGSMVWVRENIHVIKDDQNNILYLEGSMEDITKRKQADIALLEAKMHSDMANRAKTEFISNMSHELRTPLNAIIGFSDIMKNEIMGPLGQDMYKDYVTDIHASGEGLLKIINEILEISKIEAGNHELNESEFSSANTLNSCISLYASRAKDKNIILTNDVRNMPNLIGDELSIKQVIGNIYSNAIKYTPKDGRITLISSYDRNGCFRLSITDTGIGMSARDIKQALSPFGQIDNSLDRSGNGIGLGLPLAQSIMGIHGGSIEIMSERSIGTTVTIVFPKKRVLRVDENHSV